jgi:hypothetical protein
MAILPRKNLVVIVNQQFCNPRDFTDIARRIRKQASEIEVSVATTDALSAIPEQTWQSPCLTVSLSKLERFRPSRGEFVYNHPIPKLAQTLMMKTSGISVPHADQFKFGMDFPAEIWGEHVMIKPIPLHLTSHGLHMQVFRREKIASMTASDFPKDHLIHRSPMIAQKFVYTGKYPSTNRVLTLFGEVLYVMKIQSLQPSPNLTDSDEVIESGDFTSKKHREYLFGDYPDEFAFAERVSKAFLRIPLLGIDVIREETTQKLYALEVNAGGNTWHYSSHMWAKRRLLYPEAVRMMRDQYSAFDTAARGFIKATRLFAK